MKKLVTVTSKSLLTKLDKDIIKLYPLKDYTIGYEYTFDIKDIDDYCLVNRILTTWEVLNLKEILLRSNIKGIVFDDLGILEVIKDININKILLLDHLANNVRSINYYLDYVDSIVVSNDLSKREIEYIVSNAKKQVIVNVFGLKRLMYSRRNLLTNYNKYHHLEQVNSLSPRINDKGFKVIENAYGTCFYASKYYNALELLNLDNVLMYWYDGNMISDEDYLKVINESNISSIITNRLFLDKETIYKVGDLDG